MLKGAAFDGKFASGSSFTVKLHLNNIGFASIINQRPMQWVIVNAGDPSDRHVIPSPKDPREWKGSHEYVFEETIKLPALKSGAKYKLALELPDASATLSGNPEFSIRFVNEGVWDAESGLNVLAEFDS